MSQADIPDLSIIVPTLNADSHLQSCIESVRKWPTTIQLLVIDGGSDDATVQIAHDAGATVLPSQRGRGQQLARGGSVARGPWLLFLHADTVLGDHWVTEVQAFVSDGSNRPRAAAFRFALDDNSPQARRVERMVDWRCRVLGLPYGDQGLLIHRDLYTEISGYRSLPLMEDVDLVRRLGKRRIHMFETPAITSADRFRRDGWWARPSRNLFCLFLYVCRIPPRWIARLYA